MLLPRDRRKNIQREYSTTAAVLRCRLASESSTWARSHVEIFTNQTGTYQQTQPRSSDALPIAGEYFYSSADFFQWYAFSLTVKVISVFRGSAGLNGRGVHGVARKVFHERKNLERKTGSALTSSPTLMRRTRRVVVLLLLACLPA